MDLSKIKREELKAVSDDLTEILAQTIADYEAKSGKTLQPAHIERLIINTYAYREMLARKALNEAYRQQHPRFATGLMLDLCGDDVNTPRLEASASRCTIRFTLAASHDEPVVIPQSTQIAAGATVFQTASEGTLSPAGRTLDFINSRKRVRQTFKRPFPSLSCIIIQIMRINRLVSGCSVRSVREMPSEKRYGRCISDNAVHRVNSSGLSVLILPNAVHWS